jgi:antirestriction protein ArdC
VADQRTRDQREAGPTQPPPESTESAPRDIRQEAAEDADADNRAVRDRAADAVRVPTADETAESIRRAQRALHELKYRQADDARRAEDEARDEASRWQADQETRATDHELEAVW